MADGIYVSMNGAAARLAQLDAISDNLANAQTPGFKAERPSFEAFLARAGGKQPDKIYPAAVGTRIDLSPGLITHTGEPLDVLPQGDHGFLAVKTPQGLLFTRDGHLTVDVSGTLTSNRHPVVDREGQPIVAPPGTVVRIDASGTVFADQTRIADLAVYELDGPVDRVAPALLAAQPETQITAVAPHVRLGEIETANANPLEAVVSLVTAQRAFDASMQALQTSKKLDDRASEVGRLK